MKAMILAAGLGKRMRPLTEHTPKPLLDVGGKPLIAYHLEALAAAGFEEVLINTHWLAEQIPQLLGSGEKWGLSIQYSHEPDLLETAGGIRQALPFLIKEDQTFLLINGDVYSELDLSVWLKQAPCLSEQNQGYLALVPNPEHHPEGDFGFDPETQQLCQKNSQCESYTYSGIALFHASFFNSLRPGKQAMGPLLHSAVAKDLLSASITDSFWLDVGTPERLEILKHRQKQRQKID